MKRFEEDFIEKIDTRVNRGRKDLKGLLVVCGSSKNIEVHHVKLLRKKPRKGNFLKDMMSKMN